MNNKTKKIDIINKNNNHKSKKASKKIAMFCFIFIAVSTLVSSVYAQDSSVPVGVFNDTPLQKVIYKREGGSSGFGRAVQYYAVPKKDEKKQVDGKRFQFGSTRKTKKKGLSFQERAKLLRKNNKASILKFNNY